MDYQPFLEMNILVSDSLLHALQDKKIALIGLVVCTFYALFALHMLVYCIYKMMLAPKRSYPAHEKGGF